MEFNEQIAKQIIAEHNLSSDTLKTWRHRGAIPDIYFQEKDDGDRIFLFEVLPDRVLQARVSKYGDKMVNLIQSRRFLADQSENYYMTCLRSLCAELE